MLCHTYTIQKNDPSFLIFEILIDEATLNFQTYRYDFCLEINSYSTISPDSGNLICNGDKDSQGFQLKSPNIYLKLNMSNRTEGDKA